MKTIRTILFCFVGLLIAVQVQAHALWIETAAVGKLKKAQQVRIYYGEPSAGVADAVADWWSAVGSFTLMLHLPDGSSQPLAAVAQKDHYVATFTPATEGTYTLSIVKPVAETFDGHKYQFNSTAVVKVGNTSAAAATLTDFRVAIGTRDKKNPDTPVDVSVQLDGKPLKELEVTVFSPNGWSKTFQTDENGMLSFVPDRKGSYLVEALHSTDVAGEDFEHLHRISTYHIAVN